MGKMNETIFGTCRVFASSKSSKFRDSVLRNRRNRSNMFRESRKHDVGRYLTVMSDFDDSNLKEAQRMRSLKDSAVVRGASQQGIDLLEGMRIHEGKSGVLI